MVRLLMIPQLSALEECAAFAEQYQMGFEYNDFFNPQILDHAERTETLIHTYQRVKLPAYCTLHGAFFDVIPFSIDKKIREVSALRIRQSIAAAKKIGASAVVFHTNYNPFLNTESYMESWVRQNIAFWKEILEEEPQISIYLENMFDTSPDLLEQVSEALSAYENYGVCLDYAHAAISPTPTQIWAEKLGRFVKHIHLNDNDLKSDLHLAWGDGQIDRAAFYRLYETYLQNADILLETSSLDNVKRSVETLIADGFLEPAVKHWQKS